MDRDRLSEISQDLVAFLNIFIDISDISELQLVPKDFMDSVIFFKVFTHAFSRPDVELPILSWARDGNILDFVLAGRAIEAFQFHFANECAMHT